MPTMEQLSLLWESEMEFGLNRHSDDGYNVRGSHMAGTGHAPLPEFTGKRIGTIEYDPVTQDLKIIPDSKNDTVEKEPSP